VADVTPDPTNPARHRAVLLFALPARQEARAKRLGRAEALLDYSRRRVAEAVAELPGVDLLVLPQRGGGFGERLGNALGDARGLGYSEIVVVPGDVPRLGAPQLARAFALLAEQPVVLGPSPDGGIYLLGLDLSDPADRPDITAAPGALLASVAGIAWRGPTVFADLLALARQAGTPEVLEALEDLDRPADLRPLFQLARRQTLEPNLARLLAALRTPVPAPDSSRDPAPRRLALSSRLLARGPPAPSASALP
jgi:glycosyltransferase A (GT-A) superfamily protein (DUF2064 family)